LKASQGKIYDVVDCVNAKSAEDDCRSPTAPDIGDPAGDANPYLQFPVIEHINELVPKLVVEPKNKPSNEIVNGPTSTSSSTLADTVV